MIEKVYMNLLRMLYPANFYENFAGEMGEVFAEAHAEMTRSGLPHRARFLLRECCGLFIEAPRQHIAAYGELGATARERVAAAWIVRMASLALALFFLNVALRGGESVQPRITEALLQLPLLYGALLAWNDLQRGGLILAVSAALCGVVVTVFLWALFPFIGGIALLGGLLWCLPQLLFGIMLLYLGRDSSGHATVIKEMA